MKTFFRKIVRPLMFMMMIIVGTMFLSARSVGATSSTSTMTPPSTLTATPTHATWVVDVNFELNQINADWIVRVWGNDSEGNQVLLIEQHIPLYCKTYGNMQIVEERAILDGVDDYFTCDLPSFAKKVAEITNKKLKLLSRSDYQEPWVEVDAILGDSKADIGNPIFYLHPNGEPHQPDMQFYAPAEDYLAMLRFVVNNEESISHPFSVSSTSWNVLRSEHIYDHKGHKPSWKFRHSANEVLETEELAPSMFSLSTHEKTLYIGYSPIYNTYFNGEILNGSIDPGCFPK